MPSPCNNQNTAPPRLVQVLYHPEKYAASRISLIILRLTTDPWLRPKLLEGSAHDFETGHLRIRLSEKLYGTIDELKTAPSPCFRLCDSAARQKCEMLKCCLPCIMAAVRNSHGPILTSLATRSCRRRCSTIGIYRLIAKFK